jgi:hypothetical protein
MYNSDRKKKQGTTKGTTMKTYRVITTGGAIEASATYAQYGEWSYVATHNDGEFWEVQVSASSAPAFEAAAEGDPIIVGFEEREEACE